MTYLHPLKIPYRYSLTLQNLHTGSISFIRSAAVATLKHTGFTHQLPYILVAATEVTSLLSLGNERLHPRIILFPATCVGDCFPLLRLRFLFTGFPMVSALLLCLAAYRRHLQCGGAEMIFSFSILVKIKVVYIK